MERMELNVLKRETGKGTSRKLRREGSVPGILYGKGQEPLPLAVNMRELDRAVNTDAGWNVLLDLKIEGKEKVLARISEYQAEVLSRKFSHVDFQVLDLKKKIKVEVPIRFTGKAKGIQDGGIMEIVRRKLEVKCLPTKIPEHIDIDVSELSIGENIHIKDVTLPEDVECTFETNFSIVAIVAPTEEIVAEAPVVEGAPVEGAPAAEGAAPAAEGAAAPAAEGKEGAAPAKAPAAKEEKKDKAKG